MTISRPRLTVAAFVAVTFLLAFIPVHRVSRGAVAEPKELHVAPHGRADAPGTEAEPLSLAAALAADGPTRPGDTVWLRGGTYRGAFVSELNGLADAPITVRQYPGERAIIDSSPEPADALMVLGSWTDYRDFEITNSDPSRRTTQSGSWPSDLRRGAGVFAKGPHNSFINLVVHDMADGFGVWAESVGSIVHGNLIYYNGWEGPDRAHGHGIYTQNQTEQRDISDNIIFGQFSHGIHAYGSSSAFLDNITLRGNIVFNNGMLARSGVEREILLGGGAVAARPVLEDNSTYGSQNNLGYAAGCRNGVVERNYFAGVTPLLLTGCTPVMRNNTFVGATADLATAHPDNTYLAAAPQTGVVTRMRISRYEPERAQVAIYNWERRDAVEIDAPAFLRDGDVYEVIDVQDYFGPPAATRTYRAGERITIPMTGARMAAPVGNVSREPRHSLPEFGAFIVRERPVPPRAEPQANRTPPGERATIGDKKQ